MLDMLEVPIIAAPMAGGPSTPALVAALCAAGGTGFLAAGYTSASQMADQIDQVRCLTDRPFGVNLFVPNDDPVDDRALESYRQVLSPLAERFDAPLPQAHPDDEDWDAKIAVLQSNPVGMVSFTFGLPDATVVRRLQATDTFVLATVTSVDEARRADAIGYDGLVVQGPEAGGHRGTHHAIDTPEQRPLLELLSAVCAVVDLPLVAAGGLADGPSIAAALRSATAVQLGTALLDADEAGTGAVHRAALRDHAFTETTVTRCFTGRPARALRNTFVEEFGDAAPGHYPAVHQLTQPLRKAAAAAGEPDFVHLWAGTAWRSIRSGPAGQIAAELWREAAE